MQNQGFRLDKSRGVPENGTLKKNSTPPEINLKRPDPRISPETGMPPKAGSKPLQPDTSTWLTRNDAADALRRSVTTIATYERQGKLHPQHVYRPDSRGIEHRVAVYDPKELVKLRREEVHSPASREPGEVAAQSFELFNRGMTIREVVIELREPPERVQQLHESWLTTGGSEDEGLTITAPLKGDLERLVGPFTTIADLLQRIQRRLANASGEATPPKPDNAL
jgi:hypothetical protein